MTEKAANTTPPRSIRRDPVLWALVLVHLVFIGTLWGIHTSKTRPDIRVIPFDALARTGDPVRLVTRFELDDVDPLSRNLAGVDVKFELATGETVESTTDTQGLAGWDLNAPDKPGKYDYRVSPVDPRYHAMGAVSIFGRRPSLYAWDKETPIVVTGFFGTLLDPTSWSAIEYGAAKPLEGSLDTLHELRKTHELVFLREPDLEGLDPTRRWLHLQGYPQGPLLDPESLPKHRERFPRLAWGIGSTAASCTAFRAAGISHVTLGEACSEASGDARCVPLKDWPAIRPFLQGELAPPKE